MVEMFLTAAPRGQGLEIKMKTLSERINMKPGIVGGAHVIKNVNLGLNAYDTLCLICSELNIDLSNVSDSDFYSASIILSDFCNAANEDVGFTVSVWFDE